MRAQPQVSSTHDPDKGGPRPPGDFVQRNWRWMAAVAGLLLLVLLVLRQPLAGLLGPRMSAQQASSPAD